MAALTAVFGVVEGIVQKEGPAAINWIEAELEGYKKKYVPQPAAPVAMATLPTAPPQS